MHTYLNLISKESLMLNGNCYLHFFLQNKVSYFRKFSHMCRCVRVCLFHWEVWQIQRQAMLWDIVLEQTIPNVNKDKAGNRNTLRDIVNFRRQRNLSPQSRTAVSKVKVTRKERKNSWEILFEMNGLTYRIFRMSVPDSKIEIVSSWSYVQVGDAIEVEGHDKLHNSPQLSSFSPSSVWTRSRTVMFRPTMNENIV